MPRRIPDYPDAFYEFNLLSSLGSVITTFSLIYLLIVIFNPYKESLPKQEEKEVSISDIYPYL